jgi:hypothetical protein
MIKRYFKGLGMAIKMPLLSSFKLEISFKEFFVFALSIFNSLSIFCLKLIDAWRQEIY